MSYRQLFRMTLLTAHTPYRVRDVKKKKKNKSYQVWRMRILLQVKADINIDAVRKQKKTEYNKQYRLKRKLLLQQQTSKNIYMIGYFHP
jgi:spore germination cell wall hydrolase CwlJ-like protein